MRLCLLVAAVAFSAQAAEVVDRFFETEFKFHPTEATSAGFHEYDAKLEDYSRAGVEAEIASLEGFLKEFESAAASLDREIVLSDIRARLLELETRRSWENNPDRYSAGLSNSA